MSTVTRTVAVMQHLTSPDEDSELRVTFVSSYDDSGVIYRSLILRYDEWLDLGQPDEITVTIDPRDTLN